MFHTFQNCQWRQSLSQANLEEAVRFQPVEQEMNQLNEK